jgi:hypothetical protein
MMSRVTEKILRTCFDPRSTTKNAFWPDTKSGGRQNQTGHWRSPSTARRCERNVNNDPASLVGGPRSRSPSGDHAFAKAPAGGPGEARCQDAAPRTVGIKRAPGLSAVRPCLLSSVSRPATRREHVRPLPLRSIG